MLLHSQHAQATYWYLFIQDITETFLSIDDTRQARDSLEQLTQTGSVSDYITKFTHLLFRIGDILESETYYTFKKGLKHHVKIKMDDLDIQYNPGGNSLRTLQRAAQRFNSMTFYNHAQSGGHQFKGSQHGKYAKKSVNE